MQEILDNQDADRRPQSRYRMTAYIAAILALLSVLIFLFLNSWLLKPTIYVTDIPRDSRSTTISYFVICFNLLSVIIGSISGFLAIKNKEPGRWKNVFYFGLCFTILLLWGVMFFLAFTSP